MTLTDALLLASLIQQPLNITRHRTSPLINKRILRLVIQQPRNSNPLLLATTQHILPLLPRIPPALAVRQVSQLSQIQRPLQIILVLALITHIHLAVWVDDLISQRTNAQVRPLGQEHDAVHAVFLGPGHKTAVDGPETRDDARDGRLACSVGAGDQEVLAAADDERQRLDELVAALGPERGGDDGDVF